MQTEHQGRWTTGILSPQTTSHEFAGDLPDKIAVRVLNRADVLSAAAVIARSR
ncbi:MAG TPA: hypothetical protein VKA67_08150 [Verrucomicrobiae bacterium]|nr:hypothetical protein [Verrucomicrobiae bacterium]